MRSARETAGDAGASSSRSSSSSSSRAVEAGVGADRPHLGHHRAQDPGVAALVEGVDGSLAAEAEARPGAHLVALDQGEDLLHALALGGGDDEVALGRRGAGAKVDDAERVVPPVHQQAQGDRVVVEEELVDAAARRRKILRCHTHPAPSSPPRARLRHPCRTPQRWGRERPQTPGSSEPAGLRGCKPGIADVQGRSSRVGERQRLRSGAYRKRRRASAGRTRSCSGLRRRPGFGAGIVNCGPIVY